MSEILNRARKLATTPHVAASGAMTSNALGALLDSKTSLGDAVSMVRNATRNSLGDEYRPGADTKVRELTMDGSRLRGNDDSYLNELAHEEVSKAAKTGKVSDELIGFYAARGVPMSTLEKLKSGELPMDDASRAARAKTLGIDPNAITFRWDRSAKTDMQGRYRGGLVYAGVSPERAYKAAQARTQLYPLIGPPVAGLQYSRRAIKPLDEKQAQQMIERGTPDYMSDREYQMSDKLDTYRDWADQLSTYAIAQRDAAKAMKDGKFLGTLTPTARQLDELANAPAMGNATMLRALLENPQEPLSARASEFAPHYSDYEVQVGFHPINMADLSGRDVANLQMQGALSKAGYGGMLVFDEGPLSIAYHDPGKLRHASLGIMDTDAARDTTGRNIYRSVLPWAATATAAGGSQQRDKKMNPLTGLME